MKRRGVVALLGGMALHPLVVRAQPGKAVTIDMLSPFSREMGPPAFDAFEDELARLGWRPGNNIAFEYRWADGKAERLDVLFSVPLRAGLLLREFSLVSSACWNVSPTSTVRTTWRAGLDLRG